MVSVRIGSRKGIMNDEGELVKEVGRVSESGRWKVVIARDVLCRFVVCQVARMGHGEC